MVKAYPKFYSLGHRLNSDILLGDVVVTEKIDGSQFDFMFDGEKLHYRSKNVLLSGDSSSIGGHRQFSDAISHIEKVKDSMRAGVTYYCEFLNKPRHHTLEYERVPRNKLMLFAVGNMGYIEKVSLSDYAKEIDIESVPVLYEGRIGDISEIEHLLGSTSALGNAKIEGFVITNFLFPTFMNNTLLSNVTTAKVVSDSFKEVHRTNWKKKCTKKGQIEEFFSGFGTAARWRKAVNKLEEILGRKANKTDIFPILKEIYDDVVSEEKENISEFLFNMHKKELMKGCHVGFVDWFKDNYFEGGKQ